MGTDHPVSHFALVIQGEPKTGPVLEVYTGWAKNWTDLRSL